MASTTFTGPVNSLNGFSSGTSTSPVAVTTASNISSFYGTTSATSGDTRLVYDKLSFTGAGGAGETLRAFSVVSVAGAAVGGTINGAHISMETQGGTISGAGNAVRATLGGTTAAQTGTLAVIQADTNFSATVNSIPANASFIRVTNTGAATPKIGNLFNLPAAMVEADVDAAGTTHKIKFVDDAGNVFYLMATTVAP